MIQRMTYFRVKRLWLGQAYESFIQQYLEPGGTIFIVDCQLKCAREKIRRTAYLSIWRARRRNAL